MKIVELATEAWREWVKDKPFQSEDFAKGFLQGFNFCIKGQVKVSGGDKGELLYSNLKLQERIEELEAALKKIAEVVPDCRYLQGTRLDIIGDICEEVLNEQ